MKEPLNELKENIDQIIAILKIKNKIMSRHKSWLIGMLNKIINSEPANEKEIEAFRVFKDFDVKHEFSIPAFNILNHEYVQLTEWLIDNPSFKVPAKEKTRITAIIERINDFKEYTEEEEAKFWDSSEN